MEQIVFVGAGPGDTELITLKGHRYLQKADVVIYAGSLVNKELLNVCKDTVSIYDSAKMDLEQIIHIMKTASDDNLLVVRLHTGDPSIYGAIKEQMDALDELGIKYSIVPGVSSFCGAAAAIKKEFTLPTVSQTVILTRVEGRTGVPEKESLDKLAEHRASMAIFLSIGMIDKVVSKLLKGYPSTTPIAVISRATWDDELVIIGTLENISSKVKEANITKTSQILVGDFIDCEYELSKLYDKKFTHEYRTAVD